MAYLLWQSVAEAGFKHPDRLAISDGETDLTYAAFLSNANRVTTVLRDAGVGPGDRVGVLATKSVRCVSAMIGVLQAGASYIPVDPRAPAPRSKFILGNADIRFLVTESPLVSRIELEPGREGIPEAARILLLDEPVGDVSAAMAVSGSLSWSDIESASEDLAPAARNELDPAYMLYTSGSTGKPKGVVISHRNALTFVDWGRGTFDLAPDDRLSNHAPFHFDLSVFDLYGALSSGASVHLVPDRVAPFPGELARWIEETGISVWYSVPSALIRLLLHGELSRFDYGALRTILFAGEVFPVKHLRAVMEAFRGSDFYNLYGPTETNVCTYYPVPRPIPQEMSDLPIGAACANMEAFALTDGGTRAGPGEEGELLVRGPCVMLGYWGLPERTAQSLGQNPLQSHFTDLVYRTGDLVRVLEEDGFQFLGRRDHMVKVRGYRVELGEIEQAILEHAGVRESAVVAIKDEEVGARLRAAVVLEGETEVAVGDIQRHCLERLPRYAVPEQFVFLDALPRTSTGKTDRMALSDRLSRSE